jgi:hypothetical protein
MYNKVHPTEKIKPNYAASGDAHKKIDLIVEDVESELARINEIHNKELQDIFGYQNDMELVSGSKGRFHGNTSRSKANFVSDEETKSVDNDVKFSHELLASDNKIANELNEQFINVKAQLNEYKRRYLEINDKLKDLDGKLNLTESKLDETEDENLKLREELRMGGGQPVDGPKTVMRLNRPGGATQQELEMNKRSEQIRKALLADDGEDVAVNMDDLYKSRNIVAIIQGWLFKYQPFKRDIRQTQARFGSSVASYFIFLRFV